ncbi:MAG: 16S rRNA (cytidine(1402)-2'-O)-methyltransferase [Bryobacteraceae bacterium]|jgi:16S rRNA (cytidine1402-2'-O)-methyltransferase
MVGTLFIIGTPIGNLEDLSFRAVRVLREADRIACEDTRHTRRLLEHYGIDRPLVSYHEHNEKERTAELLRELEEGRTIALVSDAGTPLIADPGYRIVHAARERGIPVSPIPGPSAIMAALSAGGLATDAFLFAGFLPAKAGARQRALEVWQSLEATLVFYEAPHRVVESLRAIAEVAGARRVVVARELTKIHEEFLEGTAASIADTLEARPAIKGEFTILVARAEAAPPSDPADIAAEVAALMASGTPRMDALKAVARRYGLSKREVYRRVESG